MEHHVKEISTKTPAYLHDTPYFLRVIEKVNQGPKLPDDAILATCDGPYQNIPHEDGSKCLHEALEERVDKSVPSDFIVKLVELVQSSNIFQFHDGMLWCHQTGGS